MRKKPELGRRLFGLRTTRMLVSRITAFAIVFGLSSLTFLWIRGATDSVQLAMLGTSMASIAFLVPLRCQLDRC